MPTYPAEILFAVFVACVVVLLIIMGSVKLVLGMLHHKRSHLHAPWRIH